MIECKLVTNALSNNIFLTDTHRDVFDGQSISLGMSSDKFQEYLQIQENYKNMQKELKFLYDLHKGKK
jgi:hypothetical protein